MNFSANIQISAETIERLVRTLLTDVFIAPEFEWQALSVAIETSGAEFGYGIHGYYYDARGVWAAGSFQEKTEKRDEAIEMWIEETHNDVGAWTECIIQILRGNGQDTQAKLLFDFEEKERWRDIEAGRLFGDVFRPKELPTPLKGGPR